MVAPISSVASKSVVILMDDRTPRPKRRSLVADLVTQAVNAKASAIIIDVLFVSESPYDGELIKAFRLAHDHQIPIFLPRVNQPGMFAKIPGVEEGNTRAVVNSGEMVFATVEPYHENIPHISALIAVRLCGDGKEKRPYLGRDISLAGGVPKVPHYSYRADPSQIPLKGKIIFIGGSITPETGKLEDSFLDSSGSVIQGVDIVMAAADTFCSVLVVQKRVAK